MRSRLCGFGFLPETICTKGARAHGQLAECRCHPTAEGSRPADDRSPDTNTRIVQQDAVCYNRASCCLTAKGGAGALLSSEVGTRPLAALAYVPVCAVTKITVWLVMHVQLVHRMTKE